jgi:hypothetical protein
VGRRARPQRRELDKLVMIRRPSFTKIVKPLSPKQRENVRNFSRFQAVPRVGDANPTSSWWVGLTREQLQAAAATERTRITWSRCGRVADPKYATE